VVFFRSEALGHDAAKKQERLDGGRSRVVSSPPFVGDVVVILPGRAILIVLAVLIFLALMIGCTTSVKLVPPPTTSVWLDASAQRYYCPYFKQHFKTSGERGRLADAIDRGFTLGPECEEAKCFESRIKVIPWLLREAGLFRYGARYPALWEGIDGGMWYRDRHHVNSRRFDNLSAVGDRSYVLFTVVDP